MTERDPLGRALEIVTGVLILVIVATGLIRRMWIGAGTLINLIARKEKRNESAK